MKIIIGLGNPEKEYKNTRHNVGFEVINKISSDYNIDINKLKFKAHIGEGFISSQKVMLVKPQTYMNLSGISVSDIINFYKLTNDDIIIVYDDVSLPFGDIRIREKGSAGGHNGIKSIIQHLDTDVFLRIKVGIDEKPKNYDLADYVLSRLTKQEQEKLDVGIDKSVLAIVDILNHGTKQAMNNYNRRLKETDSNIK